MMKKTDILRIFHSRRAMDPFSLLMIIIVGTVVLFILFLMVFKITDAQQRTAERTRCQASVMAYARMNSVPFGEEIKGSGSIDCPTQFVTIKDDRTDRMRREVADLMYDCWTNYGQGKLLLFSQTDEKFCAICSVFEFEDKETELAGMASFLMNERIPAEVSKGFRPTYYEYISGVQTNTDVADDVKKADLSFLEGSQRYAILFTYYKQSYWSKAYGFLVGAGVGAATLVAAGAVIYFTAGAGTPIAAAIAKVGFTTAAVIGGGVGGGIGAAASGGGAVTVGADWDARLVMVLYSEDAIRALGCEELPVSLLDQKFR